MRLHTLLPLCLLAVPAGIQAADFSLAPDRTRYLSDPSYMQAKGELSGNTSFGYTDDTSEHYLSDGTLSPKDKTNGWQGTQALQYGVTNRFRIALSETYKTQDQTDTYPSVSNSFHASGFDNPVLSARLRAIPQIKAPLYLDFGASYSPDLFESKVASTSSDGTTASGEQWGLGAIHLGREMKSWTTQLTYAATYHGQGSSKLSNGNNRTHAAYWNNALTWDNQVRFSDRIFLNLGAGIDQNSSHQRNQTGDNPFTASYGLGTNYYLSPGYVIIPQRLTLNADFSLSQNGDQTDTYPDTVATWKNQQTLYFGLHLRYKLF